MNNHLKINVMNRDFCFQHEKMLFFVASCCFRLSSRINLFLVRYSFLCHVLVFMIESLLFQWHRVKSYQNAE